MIEWIARINSAVNNIIWGVPAIICIVGVGLPNKADKHIS